MIKTQPQYLAIQELLAQLKDQEPKAVKRYRRQLKTMKSFFKEECRLNEGTFLDERYALDYYFFTHAVGSFVKSYLDTLLFVLRNYAQPHALRCDIYNIELQKNDHVLIYYLLDNHGFTQFKYQYGCTRA